MIARRVVVRGRVQGVFFRDSARRESALRGVSGWIRNRDDGTVEALFEGDEEPVLAMVEWARSGPSRAEVEGVEVLEAEPEGADGFSVR